MAGKPDGARGAVGRILLVEDNEELRLAARDLLEGLGHEVLTAGSPERVAMLSDDLCRGVGLLLVNAYLVGGSGATVVDDFRRRGLRTPALLYSGYGDDVILRARVDRGEMGFLELPFAAKTLATRLREALAGAPGYYAPPAPARVVPMRRPQAPFRGRLTGWGRYAAAAALFAGAGLAFLVARDAPPPLPALESTQVVRGSGVALLGPLGELEAPPRRFEWEPFQRAAFYRMVLTGVDDRLLWERETATPGLDTPVEVEELVRAAVVYYWKVEAYDGSGARIGRSDRGHFRVGLGTAGLD